jgi:hypothetical protein
MKILIKKGKEVKEADDTLFGLLVHYRKHNTYIRILVNEAEKKFAFFIVENPKYWEKLVAEKYSEYRILKRVEMNCNSLFVKYLLPQHIITYLGPTMGLKLPTRRVVLENKLAEKENPYYLIEAPMRHLTNLVVNIKKVLSFTPHKKYEIIEKHFAQSAYNEGI